MNAMSASTSIVHTKDTPALGPAHPLYSNISLAPLSPTSTLTTIAGQLATSPSNPTPKRLSDQLTFCLSNFKHCLNEAGATVHDLTRLTYYFTERAWEEEDVVKAMMETVALWLEGHRPTSTLVVVKGLAGPEFLCEIEGQAIVSKASDGEQGQD